MIFEKEEQVLEWAVGLRGKPDEFDREVAAQIFYCVQNTRTKRDLENESLRQLFEEGCFLPIVLKKIQKLMDLQPHVESSEGRMLKHLAEICQAYEMSAEE